MEKFYITTSIAYVNAPPHLGFALESIQADVLARHHRQRGNAVFFLTGTDEHGAKIAKAAEMAGLDTKKFVDKNAELFRDLKKTLNLSWDNFIRTSDQKVHWPVAQRMWRALEKSGDIYKKKYRGLYCVGHEAFITGKDLAGEKCRDHQTEPEIIEEENYFFRLSKYAKEIETKIKNNELRILPEGRKNEILAQIKEGVEDVSFSRPRKDLAWGIPVPDDNEHTMYVWCDALTNYISGAPDKWPADIHLIGKDILRFHALLWPGMLISAGLPLPKNIFVHGHITVGGQKMSKTIGNVVDPAELVKKYGVDAARYYLLREIPSSEDGDFSREKFEERYNSDLANGLGNFAARVLTLGETLGTIETENLKINPEVEQKINSAKKETAIKIAEFKLHDALSAIWELIAFGDKYINDQKPWEKSKDQQQKFTSVFNVLIILDNVAALLEPFLPNAAAKITQSIHWQSPIILQAKKLGILFPRI